MRAVRSEIQMGSSCAVTLHHCLLIGSNQIPPKGETLSTGYCFRNAILSNGFLRFAGLPILTPIRLFILHLVFHDFMTAALASSLVHLCAFPDAWIVIAPLRLPICFMA